MKRKLEVVTPGSEAEKNFTEEKKIRTAETSPATNAFRFKFADLQMSCKPAQKPFHRKDDQEDPPEAAHAVLCN